MSEQEQYKKEEQQQQESTVLCIPRIMSNIGEKYIREIFQTSELGEVKKIDIVKKNTENYNIVFIHLKWNNNEEINKYKERILNGKDIKIVYDEPWFWKASAYREKNKRSSNRKTVKP